MSLKLIAIAIIAALSTPALAQQGDYCTTVDYSDRLGPVRNQGNMGWCYAFAAADLLTYKMRDQLDQPLSAVFMALANNSFVRPNAASQAGTMRLALDWGAYYYGSCLKSVEDKVFANGPIRDIEGKIKASIELKQLWDAGKKSNDLSKFHSRVDTFKSQGSILRTVPANDLETILNNSTEKTFSLELAKYLCGGNTVAYPKGIDLTSRTQLKGWTIGTPLLSHIDEQLNKENVVGIGYYANFLTSDDGRKEGGHASVIVGRKRDPVSGKCMYKIRNSWGPNCTYYTPEYNRTCEAGHLWVDAHTLWDNLVSITFIEK